MSLAEIDIIQSEKITALQNDVIDLRDKLNLVVADILALTTKLNTAISDADDINTVLNAGYSVASGGGESNTGILKRLVQLFDDLERHRNTPVDASNSGSDEESHPYVAGNAPSWTTQTCNLSGTAQGNNNARTTYTATAQTATMVANYTPEETAVMTLKIKNEKRARKAARTLVKRTR